METTTSWTQGYILVTMLLCAIHKTATTDTFDTAEEKEVGLHQVDNFYDSVMEVATELSVPHHERHGPYFDVSASKNVTALVGKTAQLNCRVHNLGNKTVSWIRHRDIHLLTTGRFTYTSDLRFQSVHNPQTEDWTLQIRYPQKRDSGVYECQVSTTPPVGHSMFLSIVEPITTIIGGPDLYVNKGSTVNLTEINYDSPRGGVSVITEKGEITTSYLLIQRAKSPDSGKYTCLPSNANPFTVTVHVLNGEYPAAMQQGGKLKVGDPATVLLAALFVINLTR
ncbi:uncharacterized protein DMENIID0001_170240 [Sergentomyia squamirostris]